MTMLKNTVIEAGTDLLNIFLSKLPVTLFLFGWRASTNEGIPIVRELINVICIGIKGYGIDANTKSMAKNIEYKVLARNIDEDFCMLLIARLPSKSILGIAEKSEFRSTIWDILLTA